VKTLDGVSGRAEHTTSDRTQRPENKVEVLDPGHLDLARHLPPTMLVRCGAAWLRGATRHDEGIDALERQAKLLRDNLKSR
jgi:hypothetical protein